MFCLSGCKSKEVKNAETCMKLKQYSQALENLETEVKNNPDNAYAYRLAGEIFIITKENKKAIKAFGYALKIKPKCKNDIALFCLAEAKEIINTPNLPIEQIIFLLKYAKDIDPQIIEKQKILLKEFATTRLEEFSDIRNGRIFLCCLCELDKQYEKMAGDVLYNFGQKNSGDAKIIAFSGALKFNQEHKQEIALFIIESAKNTTNAFLYDFIKKECQKDKELSFEKELFEAKKAIVNELLLRAKRARYNDSRDIKRTKNIFTALNIVTSPDKADQKKYSLIKKNETQQITVSPFTLSPEIVWKNYVKYKIRTDKPMYIIYSGYYGTCKIELVNHEYIFDKFCPDSQKITFLSTENTNIQITKVY